jgi:hypothetical protein
MRIDDQHAPVRSMQFEQHALLDRLLDHPLHFGEREADLDSFAPAEAEESHPEPPSRLILSAMRPSDLAGRASRLRPARRVKIRFGRRPDYGPRLAMVDIESTCPMQALPNLGGLPGQARIPGAVARSISQPRRF